MTGVAVIGSGGMLGHDVMDTLDGDGLRGFSRSELDITNAEAVIDSLNGFHTVINVAAYTQVDAAETHEAEAFQVNTEGARNIARACALRGQRLIQVSTDYVFDGQATAPYPENHPRNPVSVYGRSKAAGEEAVLNENPEASIIVRTAWLYGAAGSNFVATMLRLASEHETVSVVSDQTGQPTWSMDLARMMRALVTSNVRQGIFHGTNAGQTTWFDFAQTIFATAGLDPARVKPTDSAHFPRPAARPAWSVLGHDAWQRNNLPTPRDWVDAFDEAWATHFGSTLRESGSL